MSKTVHVFDYLDAEEKFEPASVTVVFGDESFLKRLALRSLRQRVLGDETAPADRFDGTSAQWRDIHDELATLALFGGGRRLVLIDDADDFVATFREKLELYTERSKSRNVLVLDVATWAGNTRLYKCVDQHGLQIECRAPQKATHSKNKVLDEERMIKWLGSWAATEHRVKLPAKAARLMLDLVGPEFGLLDQELAKLALFTKPGGELTQELVHDVVGGWRAKTVWELLDAACDGDAAEAFSQLERLLQSVDHPVAMFGQFSWSLRRFAAATRLFQRFEQQGKKPKLREVLQSAGFRDWPEKGGLEKAERRLVQMGRDRAGQLYRWLLEADLALKGSHSSPERSRFILEQLILRLAKQLGRRVPPATAAKSRRN
ncbi:MAG: DNA polymerase III subunit delta [Candidatus Anammoximicrobium sp.]|mgnify:CR=1 FL=1|nr:DNA polymerase III subunit delta [Candidatus Anammoximicrobium sp.]